MAETILIRTTPCYLETESQPEQAQYRFAYTIEIENQGNESIQLLERYWIITDANTQKSEVKGPGVVGEQPHIAPGETYRYQSSVLLKTPVGFMEGSYTFQGDHGRFFDVAIPVFSLAAPNHIH